MEAILLRGGFAWIAQQFTSRKSLVLAYHNILPDGAPEGGDRALHLPRGRFVKQLGLLLRTHEIVSLDSLLEGGGSEGRPRAAITFDDAYWGAVTIGVDELAQRGLPAAIFVAPGLLGGRSFWWDALADPGCTGLSEKIRRTSLEGLGGDDAAIRRWAARKGIQEIQVPYHSRTATTEELESAVDRGGITLASHTWSHPNLTRLAPSKLEDELVRPLRWLRDRFGVVTAWLSYPYGLSSPQVEEVAAAAGYRAALRLDGGRIPVIPGNLFALSRVNVPAQLSADGFALRMSGLIR
jgi:peptidoglycan/xylan/chitin deacetylase (PgdA/CDA1 family)